MVLIKSQKFRIIILFMFIFTISPAISTGYGYWDSHIETKNETVSTGYWDFMTNIGLQFAYDYETWIAAEVASDPNSKYKYIYSQTDVPSNTTMIVQNIDVFGYTWDFWGKGKIENLILIIFLTLFSIFSFPFFDRDISFII